MSSLIRAFEVMTDPAKAGPATICISQDAEGEAFDFDEKFLKNGCTILTANCRPIES